MGFNQQFLKHAHKDEIKKEMSEKKICNCCWCAGCSEACEENNYENCDDGYSSTPPNCINYEEDEIDKALKKLTEDYDENSN